MFHVYTRSAAIRSTLILVGISAAFTAVVACFLIELISSLNVGWRWLELPWQFYATAAFSGLLLGPSLWWRFIIKPCQLTVKRGVWVGILGSILAHPLTWFLLTLLSLFIEGFTPENIASKLAWGFFFLPLISLITVGWLTTLIGGLAGAIVANLQRKFACQGRWQVSLLEH